MKANLNQAIELIRNQSNKVELCFHCENGLLAEQLIKAARELGFWWVEDPESDATFWKVNKQETCYYFYDEELSYSSREYARKHNYDIIELVDSNDPDSNSKPLVQAALAENYPDKAFVIEQRDTEIAIIETTPLYHIQIDVFNLSVDKCPYLVKSNKGFDIVKKWQLDSYPDANTQFTQDEYNHIKTNNPVLKNNLLLQRC